MAISLLYSAKWDSITVFVVTDAYTCLFLVEVTDVKHTTSAGTYNLS